MIEQFIAGRELTVGILGDVALPVGEIIPKHEIYDYECKYTPGMAVEEISRRGSRTMKRATVQSLARKHFDALKLRGYARIDFRMSTDGTFYCLGGEHASRHDANESHSAGGGGGGDLVPRAVRPDRPTRARSARRRVMAHVAGPTAALAGIPAGLQAQGVWAGRRQLFVRFAAEAETATMYTADALANEIRRGTSRSAFHSISISGRDPLVERRVLCAAFAKVSTTLAGDARHRRPASGRDRRARKHSSSSRR